LAALTNCPTVEVNVVRIEIVIQALQPLPSGEVVLTVEVTGGIEGCPERDIDWAFNLLADSREHAMCLVHPLQTEIARLRAMSVEIEVDA
jgi:hypothetical protein